MFHFSWGMGHTNDVRTQGSGLAEQTTGPLPSPTTHRVPYGGPT